MFGKKKQQQLPEGVSGVDQSQQFAVDAVKDQMGGDDAFLKAILELSENDDTFVVPDPNVELNRDLAQLAMGYGEYEDILPQVTNFDHPVQASTVAVDLTELEIMRAMGLPQNIYQIIKGGNGMNTGYKLLMQGRMSVVYPGATGVEMHPRVSILGSLFSRLNWAKEMMRNKK